MFETVYTIIGIIILIIVFLIAVLIAIGVAKGLKNIKKELALLKLNSLKETIEEQKKLSNYLSAEIEAKNALLEDLNKNINRQMEKVSDET